MRIKIVIYVLFLSNLANSQSLVDESYCNFDRENRFYSFNKKVLLSQLIQKDSRVFKIPAGITLEQKWEEKDYSGVTHHCFTQLGYGIPILNGEIYVREKDGVILNATGLLNTNIPSYKATTDKENALNSLLLKLKAKKYKWQDPILEAQLQEDQNDKQATYLPKMDLKLVKLNQADFSSPDNLVYCFVANLSAIYNIDSKQYIDSTYYVEASTGKILKRFSPITNCYREKGSDAIVKVNPITPVCAASCLTTNVPLYFYGGQNINTEKFLHAAVNCTHRTKDACTSTFLYVRWIDPSTQNTQDYRNNPNTWQGTNSGGADKDGTSVLWSVEMAHDFYRLVLNRNSFDNASSQINANINRTSTANTNGTSWDLLNNKMQIIENSLGQLESSIDIVGHELTHGVMDQICFMSQDGSISATNEEGALAEGYGDIFGQAIEHFVNSNISTNGAAIDDYEHGVNAAINGITFQKERLLHTPKNNGNPDTYMGINWINTPISNVSSSDFAHVNSTIMSHWFFLLAEGGIGTNDNNNNFCVSAIGKDNAVKIAFNSLFFLGGTGKQYSDARAATIQAAIQLFGANSNEVAQTTAAWFAVGVGPNYSGVINVMNHVASGTENYAFNNAVAVQNFTALNTSNVTITSNTEVRMSPNVEAMQGGIYSAFITPACNGGARSANPVTTGTNENGNQNTIAESQLSLNESRNFNIIPNPSEGIFRVVSSVDFKPSHIIVTDMLGSSVKEIKVSKDEDTEIDLSEFPDGMYFIKAVVNEGTTITKRIIKN